MTLIEFDHEIRDLVKTSREIESRTLAENMAIIKVTRFMRRWINENERARGGRHRAHREPFAVESVPASPRADEEEVGRATL